MSIKTKDLTFKTKAINQDGFFSGYCNVFDVKDSADEIVRKGAFLESLKEYAKKGKMPPVLWGHNRDEPLGVWTKLEEDEHGLYGEGKLLINDVAKAKEIHALMLAGAIDGLSIGYRVKTWRHDQDNHILELLEIDLKEISIVTFPANEESRVDTVKSALAKGSLPTLKEFEKSLRELGFSKTQATTVASYGLRKLLNQGEPDNKHLSNTINILKQINNGAK